MKRFVRSVIILQVILLIFSAAFPLNAAFENTHKNTGNAANDIISVAQTQIGYLEGSLEGTVARHNDYTKYGSWYGLPYSPWCAMFVSWCANQAGIPTSIIPKHADCDAGMNFFIRQGRFNYASYYGGSYTPRRGDIVYFGFRSNGTFDSTHVGIIYKVDNGRIYVIEGNSSDKVQSVPYLTSSSYILGYASPVYSGSNIPVYESGKYITTATSLNFRKEPSTSAEILGKIPEGTILEINSFSDDGWGKTSYNSKSGWVSMEYCERVFTVSFNANGGSGAPKTQYKSKNQQLTISAITPSRRGYTFTGWSDSANGAVKYTPGAQYSTNADIVLYAVWKQNSYTISYNANSGQGAPAAQIKMSGEALTLSNIVPTRTGYSFEGWARTQNASKPEFAPGAIFTEDISVTLYAVWTNLVKPEQYTITYNSNGGVGAPDAQIKTEGTDIAVSAKIPSRQGYTFEGWATSQNSEPEFFAGDWVTQNSDLTLWAQWARTTNHQVIVNGYGSFYRREDSAGNVIYTAFTDKNNSISRIAVNSRELPLVGDTRRYSFKVAFSSAAEIEIDFTDNASLFINPFKDVKKSDWYFDAVEFCFKNDIMRGVAEDFFSPDSNITRASFITVLARVYEYQGFTLSTGADIPFTDVSVDAYYYEPVCWAYKNSLISGISANLFSPDSPLTREQLSLILYNYKIMISGTSPKVNPTFILAYNDAKTVSSWANKAMEWAVYEGYMSGYASMITPKATATRAQCAQIIYSFLNH